MWTLYKNKFRFRLRLRRESQELRLPAVTSIARFMKVATPSVDGAEPRTDCDRLDCDRRGEWIILCYLVGYHKFKPKSQYKHLPTKTIKCNKHKHKHSNWITKGIIKSIKYTDTLYRILKKTNPYCQQHEVMVINLHNYNNILKHSIRKAKANYYYSRFEKYNNDTRNT